MASCAAIATNYGVPITAASSMPMQATAKKRNTTEREKNQEKELH
jgi:hypothetical protein